MRCISHAMLCLGHSNMARLCCMEQAELDALNEQQMAEEMESEGGKPEPRYLGKLQYRVRNVIHLFCNRF